MNVYGKGGIYIASDSETKSSEEVRFDCEARPPPHYQYKHLTVIGAHSAPYICRPGGSKQERSQLEPLRPLRPVECVLTNDIVYFMASFGHTAVRYKIRYLGTNGRRKHHGSTHIFSPAPILLLSPEADFAAGCSHWETYKIMAPSLSIGLSGGLGMPYLGI